MVIMCLVTVCNRTGQKATSVGCPHDIIVDEYLIGRRSRQLVVGYLR